MNPLNYYHFHCVFFHFAPLPDIALRFTEYLLIFAPIKHTVNTQQLENWGAESEFAVFARTQPTKSLRTMKPFFCAATF